MASPLFATSYASAYSPAASMGNKRKRDFGDESDSMGTVSSSWGMMQPGSGRTMKRWRNGRPTEEEVYQYTLQKLFSAQSQGVQGPPPPPPPQVVRQTAPFAQLQSRSHTVAASPVLKTACPTRGPPPPRSMNTNPFAAMGHTKPAAGVGLFKFMCAGAGAASGQSSIGSTNGITMSGMGDIVVCEDCDRMMELTGFGGDDEGRCGGCTKRVCEVGCSIERGDGGRICLDCAMKGY